MLTYPIYTKMAKIYIYMFHTKTSHTYIACVRYSPLYIKVSCMSKGLCHRYLYYSKIAFKEAFTIRLWDDQVVETPKRLQWNDGQLIMRTIEMGQSIVVNFEKFGWLNVSKIYHPWYRFTLYYGVYTPKQRYNCLLLLNYICFEWCFCVFTSSLRLCVY